MKATSPDVYAAILAAKWARAIGLPQGNYWEPVIARQLLADWRTMGAQDNTWPHVEAAYQLRLGLDQ